MRAILIFSLVCFNTLMMLGQTECSDVIYPTDGESIIFDCCIDEVKNGNVVYFTKNGISHFVKAQGLSKSGVYIDLTEFGDPPKQEPQENIPVPSKYSQHNYNYYLAKYKGATAQRNIGLMLTILGGGMTIGGIAVLTNEASKAPSQQSDANINAGAGLYLAGFISINVGVPLWISGGIKRGNNKKAMDATKKNLSLCAGKTNNGMGVWFNF